MLCDSQGRLYRADINTQHLLHINWSSFPEADLSFPLPLSLDVGPLFIRISDCLDLSFGYRRITPFNCPDPSPSPYIEYTMYSTTLVKIYGGKLITPCQLEKMVL